MKPKHLSTSAHAGVQCSTHASTHTHCQTCRSQINFLTGHPVRVTFSWWFSVFCLYDVHKTTLLANHADNIRKLYIINGYCITVLSVDNIYNFHNNIIQPTDLATYCCFHFLYFSTVYTVGTLSTYFTLYNKNKHMLEDNFPKEIKIASELFPQ